MEFACVFYDVFGVGGFTGLIRGRVLTILFWAFSHLLLIDFSIKIVLSLVASFPANLVSLNSDSVCRSCVSFGVLIKAAAVLPLGGDVIFYYRSWERYYRGYFRDYFRSGPKTRLKSSGGWHGCIFLVPLASSSTATLSSSTTTPSGS